MMQPLTPLERVSVADIVFDALHQQIVSLALPPGSKVSEVEVSKAMNVSRQPVRDAFYRLSELGFLTIQPQKATRISLITEASILNARLVRVALELEGVRIACDALSATDMSDLADILQQQDQALKLKNATEFLRLDELFHETLLVRSGAGALWETAKERKAHMDRARLLSLDFSMPMVLEDHRQVLAALIARDTTAAQAAMRQHLGRIVEQLPKIKKGRKEYFENS